MTVTHQDNLQDRLDTAVERADRIERANRQQQRIDTATDSIERVNLALTAVEETAEQLRFYVGILEEVFDGSRSNCHGVNQNVEEANRKADIGEEDVLEAAREGSFADLERRIQEAEDLLADSIGTVQDRIREEYVEPHLEELAKAEELNSILGSESDEFVEHVNSMKTFLESAIRDTGDTVKGLAARWDRLREQWEAHADKQSWDRFQSEHDLSDTTVEELKQFTDDDVVRLSDLSMETLREVKTVDELESALEVALQT